MNGSRLRSFAWLLYTLVISISAFAEKPKSTAYKAYKAQAGEMAIQAVASELNRHPEQANEIRLHLSFQVDLSGRVHNAKAVSSNRDQWAEEAARRILANLELPPVPGELAAETGAALIDVEATYEVGVRHTKSKLVTRDSAETVAYLKEVDNIICAALQVAMLKRPEPRVDLTITLIVDRDGHIRGQEISSTRPSEWLKKIALRVIRTTKLPRMPEKVVTEHKDGLVAFQTQWIYDRKD
jgi:outer membrane biosynthesis protein TonB